MTEIVKEGTGMNPKIKERIEQIRQGIVPKGYKKTRVGIIPEEWELKKMKEILQFKNGVNARKEQYGRGVKFINVLDILNNNYITYENIVDRVDIDDKTLENNKVEYGDVLFQRSSETIEEAGTANVYLGKKPVTFGGFVIRGKKIGEYNPLFMNYLLKGDFYRKQVEQKAAGSTRYNIGQDSLEEIYFIDVQITEQQQIAEILSTWDRAIELKEALIKEKEEQKKGLMQYLLEKRLLNQKKVKLKDLVYEPDQPRVEEPWNIELLTVSLHNKGIKKSGKFPNKTQKGRPYYKRYKGELLIGRQNFHNGGIGFVLEEHDSLICSNAITSLLPKEGIDMYYVYYYLSNPNYYRRIESIIGGTGQKEISKKELMNLRIKAPPLKEQNKISSILFTKDKQINLLKQELSLLKDQKKGLMQLLLTGIVRVGEVEELE